MSTGFTTGSPKPILPSWHPSSTVLRWRPVVTLPNKSAKQKTAPASCQAAVVETREDRSLSPNADPVRWVPSSGGIVRTDHSGWVASKAVAAYLGITTATLKKWRHQGKGPKLWKRVSRTSVMYLVSSVQEFESRWGTATSEKEAV
jgi:hypothetical protein